MPSARAAPPPAITSRRTTLNDVHARLNATQARVLRPQTLAEAQSLVRRCAQTGMALAMMGARHAMGGQQFLDGDDGYVLDTSALGRIVDFDPQRGLITVESGIRWPALLAWLRAHPDNDRGWTIRQKQTGADDFSLGGSLASNIHGRGLSLAPFVDDVEAVEVIESDGSRRWLDRGRHPSHFALVAGGYGLFGAIVQLTLRLTPRVTLLREVRMTRCGRLIEDFGAAIDRGCTYGDFQFSVDPESDDFLDLGILSCYRPVNGAPDAAPRRLGADDFGRLLLLAHREPSRAFDEYAAYYLSSNGQRYASDAQQMGVDLGDYHAAVDADHGHRGSEMITELYVPRAALAGFMANAADVLRRVSAWPVYSTVRLIERDRVSFLAWAREPWACVVFNLHVRHDARGLQAARDAFRALIDCAIGFGGSFYLTYHRRATADQVEAAHPRFRDFLRAKRAYDPLGRWSSEWYRHQCRLFGEAAASETTTTNRQLQRR